MSNPSQFLSLPDNLSMPAATVIPVLHYPDVSAAAAWLASAFGFTRRLGIGAHRIQLAVGNGAVVVAAGPPPAHPHAFSLMVRVRDVDAHARVAEAAGARIVAAPETFPYGERQYGVEDPGGYIWTFSQSVANVDPASWGGQLADDLSGNRQVSAGDTS